jgi:hypothetical protein
MKVQGTAIFVDEVMLEKTLGAEHRNIIQVKSFANFAPAL